VVTGILRWGIDPRYDYQVSASAGKQFDAAERRWSVEHDELVMVMSK